MFAPRLMIFIVCNVCIKISSLGGNVRQNIDSEFATCSRAIVIIPVYLFAQNQAGS